ncbi:MAG: AAA family ATPase [Pseudomonadota bacterium]
MDGSGYIKALTDDPFNSELRYEYARFLLAHGDVDAAQRQLKVLLQQEASNPDYLRLLTQCQGSSDQPVPASEHAPAEDAHANNVLQLVQPAAPDRGPEECGRAEVTALARSARVTFNDIVGMDALKKTVRMKIIEPFVNPSLFARFKKVTGGGIMLYGPPGCGKTMLAKAIAYEIKAEFLAVDITDVLSRWLGESESNMREVFQTARASKPCVLYFDELDALAISRSKTSSDHIRSVVNEFLVQLDGLGNDNEGILILGATNMPWDVDSAAKRPGRFSEQIFVPPPDEAARTEMFRQKLIDVPTGDIDYETLGKGSRLFTGADVEGVIERAKENALMDMLAAGKERTLTQADLQKALADHHPSSLDWLRTARNLVKFGGVDRSYRDVAAYIKRAKI